MGYNAVMHGIATLFLLFACSGLVLSIGSPTFRRLVKLQGKQAATIVFGLASLASFVFYAQTSPQPQVPATIPSPTIQTPTVFDARTILDKTPDEISAMLGTPPSESVENTAPVGSSYTWELDDFYIYANSVNGFNGQGKATYLDIALRELCDMKRPISENLALFSMSPPTNNTTPAIANNTVTWEPFDQFDKARLLCYDQDQVLKIIFDSTAGL